MMNNRIAVNKTIISLGGLAIVPLLGAVYYALNRSRRTIHMDYMAIDEKIPFVKVFIIPYMSWMPFILSTLVYFCLKHRKLYYRVLGVYTVNVLLCYAIFYFYPTTVPRPDLTGDGLLDEFVRWMYTQDEPYNCFPSIHVMTSYLMWIYAVRHQSTTAAAKGWISLFAFFIIVSTVLVKQHSVLDVAGGIALAEISYRIKEIVRK